MLTNWALPDAVDIFRTLVTKYMSAHKVNSGQGESTFAALTTRVTFKIRWRVLQLCYLVSNRSYLN